MGFENSGKRLEDNKLFKFAALMSVLLLVAVIIDIGLFIAAASAVAGIARVAVAGIAGVFDGIIDGLFKDLFLVFILIVSALGFSTLIVKIACGEVPWGELAWLLAALAGLFLSGSFP